MQAHMHTHTHKLGGGGGRLILPEKCVLESTKVFAEAGLNDINYLPLISATATWRIMYKTTSMHATITNILHFTD